MEHEEYSKDKLIFIPSKRLAVNSCYTLAVNDYDELFSWGSNKDQKLGHKESEFLIQHPLKYDYFINKYLKVVEVACGNDHIACVAVPKDGNLNQGGYVFTWGLSLYGRLGNSVNNNTTSLDLSK